MLLARCAGAILALAWLCLNAAWVRLWCWLGRLLRRCLGAALMLPKTDKRNPDTNARNTAVEHTRTQN
eukprot:7360128-Lingulodinium_polyedra.AAC.1